MSITEPTAPQIFFSFDVLTSTVEDPAEVWQLLLKINASFAVWIDGKEAYREVDFPVVEFASQATAWLCNPAGDFLYRSMESDDEPLLGFCFGPNDILTLKAPHQSSVETAVDRQAVRAALADFIVVLKQRSSSDLQIAIEAAL